MKKNKKEKIAKEMFREEKDSEEQIIYIYDQELFEKRHGETRLQEGKRQFLFCFLHEPVCN